MGKVLTAVLLIHIGMIPIASAETESKAAEVQEEESQAVSKTPSEPLILKAKRVEQVSQVPTTQPRLQAPPPPKRKKPLPVYLQPIEFVVSSVVHAITFWKTGDELN